MTERLVGYLTSGAAMAHMGGRKSNTVLDLEMSDFYWFKELHGCTPL
jgi:hypothetical protein